MRGIDVQKHRIVWAAGVDALWQAELHDLRKGQHPRHAHRSHVQREMEFQLFHRDERTAVFVILPHEQFEQLAQVEIPDVVMRRAEPAP